MYGINQAIVQRYLAVKKLRHAQATVYINLPATILSISMFVVLGLAAYARYYQCDPYVTKRIEAFDQLIPLMVMDVLGMYPGLPGLFVACVFSASLSTVSSGVNALALVYLEDGVKPAYRAIKKKELSDRQALVTTKVIAALFGVVTIGLAYLAALMNQTLVTITIRAQGMTGGPLLGVFLLAMFFPCANSWGAGVGLLCGLSFSFWLGVGTIMNGPKNSILPLFPINCSAAVTSAGTGAGGAVLQVVTSNVTNMTSVNAVTTAPALTTATSAAASLLNSTLSAVSSTPPAAPSSGLREEKALNPDHFIPVWRVLKGYVVRHKKRYDVWRSHKKQNSKINKDYVMHAEEG